MSHRNLFRKAISVLLALVLVLSLAPVRAMTAGQEVPVCGCESDDPSWHAPFCEAYVAPEDPQCLCVEKCAEGAANEWCEVCYFGPAACAASGEEEAAVYATAPNYIASIGIAQDGNSGSTGINDCKNELSGHTIIDRDLNDGAGGDYVYMGYKTTTDPAKAITGIVFRVGGSPPNSITYNGYTFYLVGGSTEANTAKLGGYIDLNGAAGGDYIYMYVTRDPSYGAPLIDMTVDESSSKSGYSTGTNTSGSVIDLNQKAGGDYIYLHYKQFSATVKATYHYLTASGDRTSSTQSRTVKNHQEAVTTVPSVPSTVTYDGRTFTFNGWREDDFPDSPNVSTPSATYMTGEKVYRAVYTGNVVLSFNARDGKGAPASITTQQYISAGSSGVVRQSLSITLPTQVPTHSTKCIFYGWTKSNHAGIPEMLAGGKSTPFDTNTTLNAVYYNAHQDGTDDGNHATPVLCPRCGKVTTAANNKHSYNEKGVCACGARDHVCPYINGFCPRCDGFEPAELVDGYYQIGNGGQLFWFAEYINTVDRTANAKLIADINLEGRLWTPIGFTGETNNNFRGHFDGQGHTITGLNVEGGRSGLGFFGEVRLGTVENFTIYGEVKLIGKYDYVGGVIGSAPGVNENKPEHNGATIRNITSYVNVTLGEGSHGSNRVGGFIGYANHETLIENCAWYGTLDLDIYRAQDGVGGLLGKANDNSTVTIRNCGAYGTIRTAYKSGSYENFDTIYIGGIISNSVASAQTTIENTLWAGKIVNETNLGTKAHIAAFGTLNGIDSVTDCYALDNAPYLTTNGTHDSYITPVTTEQLASGEVAYKLGAAWGQTIGSNAYPILGGKKVYFGYADCQATEKSYANAPLAENVGVHSYDENGFCTMCGGFQPATGSGTSTSPYQIGNAGQLYWFAAVVNKGYDGVKQKKTAWAVLTDDITVNTGDVAGCNGTKAEGWKDWTPIGKDYYTQYAGTFDGKEFTVSGLYVNENTDSVGLFGYVGLGGTVKNVGVVDSYISGSSDVGGVMGFNYGTVANCYNTGSVCSSDDVGGVVGHNSGTVEDCYNTGSVSGNNYVGGVVGYNTGTVESCYNTGSVCGSDDVFSTNIGGVVGGSGYGSTVENCYNTGAVSGSNQVGGVMGQNGGTVEGCYNTGSVCGSDDVFSTNIGGVVGTNYGLLVNCYYNSTVYSGNAIGSGSGTATNVEGKTTEQFKSGEVAFLLQGEQTQQVWGQNIDGEGEKDAYPVFSDAKVYQAKNCKGEISGYSNTDGKQLDHTYNDNGFCTVCGGFQPATGSGTSTSPYKIGNAGQLYWFAAEVNDGHTDAWAELTADIVVNENVLKADGTLNGDGSNFLPWTPIGTGFDWYTGTFNGNGKTVSGLYVNANTNFVGLFGFVYGGTVKNVGVVDSYISGSEYVGGVVGNNYKGTVVNSYSSGSVTGGVYIGGVAAYNEGGTVANCYNTGSVCGSDDSIKIGGVVGFNSGSVEDCYNTGAVSGSNCVGGVVGSSDDPVANCYNTGNVSGDTTFVGGVVGSNYGPVVNCYYDSTVYSGNAIGFDYQTSTNNVEGKTTEQFKSGEVAYLLQGEQTQQVWGQNIDGEGEKDAYPVFSDAKVYAAKNCANEIAGYSNTDGKQLDHTYENGFCTVCGGFQPATGDGTQDNPYKIGNAGQLYWFAAVVNAGYDGVAQNAAAWAELTANITVNADVLKEDGTLNGDGSGFLPWTPIGNSDSSISMYTGTFNGNGKTVSGLYVNANTNNVGLFGDSKGTVKNVGVVDSYLSGSNSNVGGVVGQNHEGTITGCYNAGTVSGLRYVGGVVGNNSGTVANCYNTGNVSGYRYVGGVVGYIIGSVNNCYNTGNVSGKEYVGGVVGQNDGTVLSSYNSGDVSGKEYVGGVVGQNNAGVLNSYNSGSVGGSGSGSYIGGVVGENSAGVYVMNCYYDSTVYSGNAIGSGEETATNVEGKTTEQFKSGEVAYLLQGEQTQQVWGQNIDGEGEKDAYPVFSDAKVYPAKNCDGTDGVYSNTQDVQKDHIYSENGFCTFCEGFQPATGDGTESNPYQIGNAGQLYWFAKQVNSGNKAINGKLTANIAVNENVLKEDGTLSDDSGDFRAWTPIGKDANNKYTGTFDGNGKTVSGLYFDGNTNFVGLFGWSQGTVKNVGVVDSYFCSSFTNGDVGGVVGYNNIGTVENCYNAGAVKSSGTLGRVGGVVGSDSIGTIKNCYNTGAVSGEGSNNYVGGVVGYIGQSTVENCYNTGAVRKPGVLGKVGGVVGYVSGSGTIKNCYNRGAVISTSLGTVAGGVLGNTEAQTVTVENCYYDSTVYNGDAIGGTFGGTATNVEGKTTEQFKSGEVAYLLQGEQTQQVWGQNIDGEGEKDAYPVFSDAKVYRAKNCMGETAGYSNTDGKQLDHTYENGFCTLCGGFQPASGSGIESDPYKIGNAGQLYWFAAKVNDGDTDAWAVLTANITVNTGDVAGCNGTKAEGWKDWTPIGKDYDPQYVGIFDGKEFTVSGLYFNNSGVSYVGLFGFSNGTIKNVGIVASYFHGNECVGGVVGYNTGTVESCYNTGTVSGSDSIGGVVGFNVRGTMVGCYNIGTVSGSSKVGGVVGNNSGTTSTVESCYNTGTVSGSGDVMIGGVVGNNEGTVEGCYNAGPVSGTGTGTRTGIGGVTGYNYGTVEGCYNAGPVSGSSKVGGVVGFNVKGTMVGCYNIGTVSGRYAVGGVVGDNTGGDVTNCYNTGAVSASGESVGGVAGSNGGDISCCYNTGTVSGSSKVGGVVGYNGAGFTVINSYNNSDAFSGESIGLNDGTAVDVLNKTGAQFASGEVTYLLQREQTEQVWGQNVDGEGEKDAYPIFSEVEVYPVSCCPGEYGGYSNTEGKQQAPKYNENGFCIYCGGYESAKGRGTKADPYQISNAGQLYWFAAVVNTGYGDVVMNDSAWAELTANITVNEAVLKADGSLNDGTFQAWTPISGLEVRYFGTFDGNGFAVSGLYFHDTTAKYAGLFGFLEGDAVVRNVGVVDSYISGSQCIGAVVGGNMGTVEGCYNAGTVIVGEGHIGGVVGENGGSITNCYNTGAVSGVSYVGGVMGQNGGFLTNCYNAGPVSGSGERIGGLAGFNVGFVTNCYYDSTVYSGEAFGNSYGTATKVEGKSTAEFASGAVTYSLSQGCTVGETTYSGDVWGQNIDGDDKDAYPLFSNAKVYFGYYDCLGSYTNNASVSQVKPGHSGQLTYADNGDDATHTVTCDTCGDVVDASQIHSYGEDHKCLCGAVEEVLSVTISWGSMVFVYTEEAGWNNPDSAWVKTENTGNLQISVTYTYETDRTDIAGIFSNGTNSAAGTAVILPEQTYQVWLRLEGKPGEVLDNAVIGTVKVTVG